MQMQFLNFPFTDDWRKMVSGVLKCDTINFDKRLQQNAASSEQPCGKISHHFCSSAIV